MVVGSRVISDVGPVPYGEMTERSLVTQNFGLLS
jgi:hypothetical protein